MDADQRLAEFRERVIAIISAQRIWLAISGIVIVLLGVLAILLPLIFLDSILWLIGVLLIGSGLMKLLQWCLGRHSQKRQTRGVFGIAIQIAIDLLLGSVLLWNRHIFDSVLAVILGLAFMIDGGVQILLGMRLEKGHRISLLISGGVTLGVGLFAAVFCYTGQAKDWICALIGIKLVWFGVVLIYMAWSAKEGQHSLVYGRSLLQPTEKIPGELYAVFIGNAFHLGVYVGDNCVVDFRDDNMVQMVTWERFLLGRDPQHREYPDLDPISAEDVCKMARKLVGTQHKYEFLTFNCEHFAVWCKSGGKTRYSKYCQVAMACDTVGMHPFVGTFVELYTRLMEYLAYHFGGTYGKKVSLRIRRVSSLTAQWLITRGQKLKLPSSSS